MALLANRYMSELYAQTKYFATWFPNTRVRLGDYGVLEGKQFLRQGSLKDFGLTWGRQVGAPVDFDHTSGSDATVTVRATAEGGRTASSEIDVDFGAMGAWVFQAVHCEAEEFSDARAVGMELVRLHGAKLWDKRLVFVDAVLTARRASIFVASTASAKLNLGAKGALPAGTPVLTADLSLTVRSQRGSITKFIAESGLTPLFGLSRVVPARLGLGKTRVRKQDARVLEKVKMPRP